MTDLNCSVCGQMPRCPHLPAVLGGPLALGFAGPLSYDPHAYVLTPVDERSTVRRLFERLRPENEQVMSVVKNCPHQGCGYQTNIKGDMAQHRKEKHPHGYQAAPR